MKCILTNLLMALAILLAPLTHASSPETPRHLKGATIVTAGKALELMNQGALLVDSRVALEYVTEHIKGAVNIPYKEKSRKSVNFNFRKDSFDISKLPANKNMAIIIYCNAGKCWRSYKAAKAAIRSGYKNVYWLRGGIPEWKQKGLPVE